MSPKMVRPNPLPKSPSPSGRLRVRSPRTDATDTSSRFPLERGGRTTAAGRAVGARPGAWLARRWAAVLVAGMAAVSTALGPATGQPARDLTFFVVSDTHYGLSPEGDRTVPLLVDKMNALPGTPYPAALGGRVGTPRGVLHAGDVTNGGKREEWERFVADYGLTGKEGRLKWPVYEGYGNHDGGPGKPVRDGIRARNRTRPGLTTVSANGLHYGWIWDGVLFLNLGVAPGSTTNPYDPEFSMEFLAETLGRQAKPGQPLFLMHHFGFDKPYSLGWWTEDRRTRYHELIADRHVIGIVHGHAHLPYVYRWRGIDVFHPPHFRQEDAKRGGRVSHGFYVFHLSDDTLSVAERRLDDTWGLTFRKKLDPLAAAKDPVTTKPGVPQP